jgi:hypothetical protein
MATAAESARAFNETLFQYLGTPGMEKRGIDAVNDFTRLKVREDGFYRRIIPPLQLDNSELDRQVDTDKPVKVVDKEPDSPAAISIPFANLPINVYILGSRYRVLFDRIVTPRFTKDVDELRTWVMDIRQVMSDNAIKDMLAEEDSKFLTAVNTALVAPDTLIPATGSVQWQTLSGGITRDTWEESLKIMPRAGASVNGTHLEVHTALLNNVTIREFMKWGRDEMGGDFSQDLVKNGWTEMEFSGKRLIITIKRDLVPDDSIYFFSDPKFIGKSYLLEDTTMFVKREAYFLEFFAYETTGGAIGNMAGLARADFQ